MAANGYSAASRTPVTHRRNDALISRSQTAHRRQIHRAPRTTSNVLGTQIENQWGIDSKSVTASNLDTFDVEIGVRPHLHC